MTGIQPAPNPEPPGSEFAAPLFLLAPPRSFSSVVCAMLGQHPQTYGLPETQLFGAETMAQWWARCERATYPMEHGLLRVVAQLFFREQTERSIGLARGWLRRRVHLSTGMVFELLAQAVHPRIAVDKSPSIVYHINFLDRVFAMFPQARFLHLVRHPIGHGESVLKAIREAQQQGPVPDWLVHLASCPNLETRDWPVPAPGLELDPQFGWHALHMNILNFLEAVPEAQKMRIRGEDLLTKPDPVLAQVAGWLGLRVDPEAIEEMKHPERSPYACYGPPGAVLGNDAFFLHRPALRPERGSPYSLDEPVSWYDDGRGLLPKVKQLAGRFGYT